MADINRRLRSSHDQIVCSRKHRIYELDDTVFRGAGREVSDRATSDEKEGAMPKLHRLTIVTLDPERLAGFYEQVFEMRRVPNPKGEAIYLSDGYFNLTLIPNRACRS